MRAASHRLEASSADIETADGRVFVAGTDRSLTFREIAKAVYSEIGRLPRDAREELEVTKVYDPYFGTTTSATHIVALEIDRETYRVKLNRYVVAEDCGRMINPMIVDGQVHGAVAQGIGAALYEEVIYDDAGQLLTASLADLLEREDDALLQALAGKVRNARSEVAQQRQDARGGHVGVEPEAAMVDERQVAPVVRCRRRYSTVTVFARFRGWSTGRPRSRAIR